VEIRVAGQPGVWSCSRATDIRPAHIGCAYGPAVACGGRVHESERKANGCFGMILGCSQRVS
jgi:hypothetical protein